MNTIIKTTLLLSLLVVALMGCKKQSEEGEMTISLKTGTGYTHEDATLAAGTDVTIGIEAETDKEKDPIIKFNISESVNGGTASSIYTEDLEGLKFEYDYDFTVTDSVSGNTHLYVFTVTNRDGLTAQQRLTITVQ